MKKLLRIIGMFVRCTLYSREFMLLVGNDTCDQRLNFEEVHDWAVRAHGTQGYGMTSVDDGGMDGWHHYRYHLTGLVQILRLAGIKNMNVLMAALLHDVFEDTRMTVRDAVLAGIPLRAVAIAWACTDGQGPTREIRKAEAYRKLRRICRSRQVKIADRIHNAGHALESGDMRKFCLYQKEDSRFRSQLRSTFCVPSTRRLWHHLEWIFSDQGQHILFNRSQCCGNAAV